MIFYSIILQQHLLLCENQKLATVSAHTISLVCALTIAEYVIDLPELLEFDFKIGKLGGAILIVLKNQSLSVQFVLLGQGDHFMLEPKKTNGLDGELNH